MGTLLLIVVWMTAVLCAVAAGGELRALWRWQRRSQRRERLTTGWGLFEGTVREGRGPDGVLATHTLEQVGRALDGTPRRIGFWDRSFTGEQFGGTVDVAGTALAIPPAPAGTAEVWPRLGARQAPTVGFEAAWAEAIRAKGWVQQHRQQARVGDRVFVIGQLTNSGGAWSADAAGLAISFVDPRSFFSRRIAWGVCFIVAELALCAGLTAATLWVPVFGTVSMLGAAGLVAFFLGVTPIGVAYKKACRLPSVAFVRGEWNEASPAPVAVQFLPSTDAKSLN